MTSVVTPDGRPDGQHNATFGGGIVSEKSTIRYDREFNVDSKAENTA